MPAGPTANFSILTLLTLFGVLGLSAFVFWALVRRATSHRHWVALSDWGRARGFRYHPLADGTPPAPFSWLAGMRPTPRLWLSSKPVHLIQLQPPTSAVIEPVDPSAPTAPATWNVLIRQVESNWPPVALRPAGQEHSLLDLFSLASFPSMMASERFVIFGTDSAAARTIAKSSLPALLPPDVGLLLHGQTLVLDFSKRPFDTLEFDRMLALGNHLTSHLPAQGER